MNLLLFGNLWLLRVLILPFLATRATIGPPVKCAGPVPEISEGKYYFHDNGTYLLRFSTSVDLTLSLNQRSCFQVNLVDEKDNETVAKVAKLSSLFYAFRYVAYQQTYDIRSEYEFGIAELQSTCRCDCPKGDNFCDHKFENEKCSRGEVCVTKYHSIQNSDGCPTDDSGPAKLCCEVSVRPYKNRRFTAVSFVDPRPQTQMEIDIYTLYENKWTLFRQYKRTILPFVANTLRLNGYENVADLYIRAQAETSQYYLKNGDKWYEDHEWNVGDPMGTLHTLQRPRVTNCKAQKYTDRYDVNFANVVVIRNSTGSINAEPYLGVDVLKKQPFISKIRLGTSTFGQTRDKTLTVSFLPNAAPSLNLDVKLHQKMSIIAHAFASYLEDFRAQICLDKHSNRYMNVTLIKSFGEFGIEIFRDQTAQDMDLVLSMTTKLPFATNYSEILPLPGFVSSSRLVCVFAANKPRNRLCKWSSFEKEPKDWFQLKNSFIGSEGSCPGCNRFTGGGFFSNFNPKNWFNGINSLSEGIAMGLEIALYIVVLIILVAVWRKCLYPLVKWSLCSSVGEYKPDLSKQQQCEQQV